MHYKCCILEIKIEFDNLIVVEFQVNDEFQSKIFLVIRQKRLPCVKGAVSEAD